MRTVIWSNAFAKSFNMFFIIFKKLMSHVKTRLHFSYRLLGGIATLVVKDDIGHYPDKSGLYVLTQASDGGATLANRKNFRAKDFS